MSPLPPLGPLADLLAGAAPAPLLLGLAWSAPAALLGLLLLPALWWLHRRIARPPRVEVASLLFFVEDAGALVRADRRRRDLDLLLTLGAGALLALAAAGPVERGATPGRHVRAVVAGGAASAQRGLPERVQAALAGLRAALDPQDRLEVLALPERDGAPLPEGPRPAPEALAALARAGDPDLALVLSDVLPATPPGGVRWVALGDGGVSNLGLVAAHLGPAPAGPAGAAGSADALRLLLTLRNAGARPVRAVLRVLPGEHDDGPDLARREVRLAGDEVAAVLLPLPAAPATLRARLEHAEPQIDALAADDEVLFVRRPLAWGAGAEVEQAGLLAPLERALRAALGEAGLARAADGPLDLWVTTLDGRAPAGARRVLRLTRPGDPAAAQALAPLAPGALRSYGGPLVRDLDLTGQTLALRAPPEPAPGAADGPSTGPARTLLGVLAGALERPLLLERGADLLLLTDVAAGAPPLTASPFWPLLLDNLVQDLLGAPRGGVRVRGLLDPASTRLGRAEVPLPAGVLAGVAARGPAPERALRPIAAVLALLALGVLWVRGAGRRTGPSPAAG